MKALTIIQPWASLLVSGKKTFETRSWPAPEALIGQRVAIHAGAKKPETDLPIATISAMQDALELGVDDWQDVMPVGVVLGTGILSRCLQVTRHFQLDVQTWAKVVGRAVGVARASGSVPTDLFGDFSKGRWLHEFTDIEPFPEPIPARGQQRYWNWAPPI